MTRDYAKKSPPRPKKRAPMPPWLWMITGLLIGLFVAFLVYINQYQSPAPSRATSAPASKPAPQPRPAARPAPKPPAPVEKKADERVRFDFYKILPEYEVVIPDEELKQPAQSQAVPGKYIVQAGSFRKPADADTRRAQLALLGLVSKIQTVTIDGKDSWHRVQLGPYENLDNLDDVRKRLRENGIEFLLLKVKG